MAGGMPYIFLIIDLLVRWAQGLAAGEMVLPTLRSSIVILFNIYQILLYCHCHYVSFDISSKYCHIQIHVVNHGSLSSFQPISAVGLHVAIAHLLAGFRVSWLIIFRSRSTRRPAPSNCQRTNERTTKLAVSQIIFPHPPTFQAFSFAKWRQQKTSGPTQKGPRHIIAIFITYSSNPPFARSEEHRHESNERLPITMHRQGRPSK